MKKTMLWAAMALGCGFAAFGTTTWKDSNGITWEFERDDLTARRNPFGDNADAKALAAELAALGTHTLTDGDGIVWSLKVASNGVATIARTTGTGKNKKTISATAVVAWNGGDYGPYAVFLVDGKIIDVYWGDPE